MNKVYISLIAFTITAIVVFLLDYFIFKSEYCLLTAISTGTLAFLGTYFVIKKRGR